MRNHEDREGGGERERDWGLHPNDPRSNREGNPRNPQWYKQSVCSSSFPCRFVFHPLCYIRSFSSSLSSFSLETECLSMMGPRDRTPREHHVPLSLFDPTQWKQTNSINEWILYVGTFITLLWRHVLFPGIVNSTFQPRSTLDVSIDFSLYFDRSACRDRK